MTQPTIDYQQYIIVNSDTKHQRLTKVRNFLLQLKESAPYKFNYSSYVEARAIPSKGTTATERSDYHYNVVNPVIKNAVYNCPVTPDEVRNRAIHDESHCGTCACVAGWATILSAADRLYNDRDNNESCFDFFEIAASVLSLKKEDGEFLFFGKKGYGNPKIQIYGNDRDNIDEAIRRLNILIEHTSE